MILPFRRAGIGPPFKQAQYPLQTIKLCVHENTPPFPGQHAPCGLNLRTSILLLPHRKDSVLYLKGREGGKEEGRRRAKLGMETPFIMMFFNSLCHKLNN